MNRLLEEHPDAVDAHVEGECVQNVERVVVEVERGQGRDAASHATHATGQPLGRRLALLAPAAERRSLGGVESLQGVREEGGTSQLREEVDDGECHLLETTVPTRLNALLLLQ